MAKIVSLLFLVAVGFCWPVLAATTDYFQPKLLTGSIYDKAGGRLLFTFRRTATQTGEVVRVLREFRSADGSLAAQERLTYERGHLTRFELDELQIGANGQALMQPQGNRLRIDFQYTTGARDALKQKRKLETLREEPLISDTLPAFLAEHWEELDRGATVKFRYLVVPRLETIAFKLNREATSEFNGKKVVRIKMEPANWMIAQVLDPLLFTVERDPPHRILHYWGRTTPKIRTGDAWRDLDALTVFDWD
jgi:hypothetical protein